VAVADITVNSTPPSLTTGEVPKLLPKIVSTSRESSAWAAKMLGGVLGGGLGGAAWTSEAETPVIKVSTARSTIRSNDIKLLLVG
jgi:hypothetical protein